MRKRKFLLLQDATCACTLVERHLHPPLQVDTNHYNTANAMVFDDDGWL